jgi:zinc/manganese transport system permease protein
MFSTFMINTWIAASIVAVVAGTVGFFAVLRGSAFAAHVLPQGAFAGAAGAALLGLSTILGLAVFAVLGALTIGLLGKRGRHDTVTALTLVLMLGLGALFLSFSVEYAPEIYSLLFGEVLGVSRSELIPIGLLGLAAVLAIVTLYRPLLLSSVMSDGAEARGLNTRRIELCFLLVMALATSVTVPVVGTFLMFSLMIAPAGSARTLTGNPLGALALSILIALATVWVAIAAAYETNWPIGFYVGTIGAAGYALARTRQAWHARRSQGSRSDVSGRVAAPMFH